MGPRAARRLRARQRPMKMVFLLRGEKVAEGRCRMRGPCDFRWVNLALRVWLERALVTRHASLFIVFLMVVIVSADRRCEAVSGALRGGQGRESGRGLSTRDLPLVTCHCPRRVCLPVRASAMVGRSAFGLWSAAAKLPLWPEPRWACSGPAPAAVAWVSSPAQSSCRRAIARPPARASPLFGVRPHSQALRAVAQSQ